MTPISISSIIKKYSIRPKKRLGQHFLTAQPTARKIVDSLKIQRGDIVMEIGCGPGIMTEFIAKRAGKVIAVELDANLLDIAKEELAEHSNIIWLNEDILKLNLDTVLGQLEDIDAEEKIKIIGNLPYNISSPVIFWMIDSKKRISEALIMLQREVALRMIAKPGNKDYGILSVLTQTHAECRRLFDVSKGSFVPQPDVTSSVIRMDFKGVDYKIADEDWFKMAVKGAFGKRRKTLRNALLGAKNLKLSVRSLDSALGKCGIDGRRRPETLEIEEFIALAHALKGHQ